MVLIEIFGIRFGWLPVAGMDTWQSYLMPAFALSLFMMAGIVRLLRSSMLDVLDSEFVKFARIEGLPERTVILKHALRNALIPVVTFAAVYIALFLTGAIVIETVFAWPGLGSLLYSGLLGRDFPVVQAVVMLMVAITVFVNLLVDVLYSYLDPRVRIG
ncbi:MAG TPA: ABC transporter permease [Dehalococcoidia bacterium]|nr:ABC transporter permease [Dehalococcoidia bacterium]